VGALQVTCCRVSVLQDVGSYIFDFGMHAVKTWLTVKLQLGTISSGLCSGIMVITDVGKCYLGFALSTVEFMND